MRTHLLVAVALLGLGLSAQKPAPKPAAKPAAAPQAMGPGTYATFDTSKGKFVVQLFPKDAPKSVANFVALAQGKKAYSDPATGGISMAPLYTNLLFFRSVPGYMVQTGDPLNNGTGKLGYSLPVEHNNLHFDQPGRMALAQVQGDPSSRGSQVFFTLKAVPELDKEGFLVIGQVVQGLDVVQALSEGPRKAGQTDVPAYPNILNKVTITQK
ncbi:MAG TPA: peptidylprolyl isomerase [Terriglobales bacterium]|nr:peptidylprolyl isomerase [Terriglobales bacterium]